MERDPDGPAAGSPGARAAIRGPGRSPFLALVACDLVHAARRRFWISERISAAARGILGPGPERFRASIKAGTRVLWPAAWVDMPTMWTSFSTAWRAASSGVWNSGPVLTSKPIWGKGGAM